MIDALKRLDKKFLIFIGIIFCLPILLVLFLAILQGCGNSKMTHEKYEEKMISALENYMEDADKTPTEEGEVLKVELSTLVEKGYIKSTEKALDDSTCTGNVYARRNGASIDINEGGYLNYIVNLTCDEYSTPKLVDKIKDDIVTSEDGLYQVGENYIFKGKNVDNYINFFGHTYRIMSIDKDGILKLIKDERESVSRIWDNKFNTETNKSSGKNIYKDSLLLQYLLSDYSNVNKISTKAKKHIVARDVCIGKRASNDFTISNDIDCSEKLEKQVISILNVSDYASASLDSECKNLRSRSCNNYNYLYESASSTWTLNSSSSNTYEAICLSEGLMEVQYSNDSNKYNLVIYIDGNKKYTKLL